jgi:L-aspartate oxidase
LASNSLLEAVVFGGRAGAAMATLEALPPASASTFETVTPLIPSIGERELRAVAWNSCGILRSGPELAAADVKLRSRNMEGVSAPSRSEFELRNIHQVARLISAAALAREESRGGHYRTDFPAKAPLFKKHSLILRGVGRDGDDVRFV